MIPNSAGIGPTGKEESVTNPAKREAWAARAKRPLALATIALILLGDYAIAQNLGSTPQFNVAVQGQTGAQPEGAFLNFIVSWLTGRGFGRWLFAAGALLAVSGVTRLIEYWITNGTGGVT
jgi:hypothetical protein